MANHKQKVFKNELIHLNRQRSHLGCDLEGWKGYCTIARLVPTLLSSFRYFLLLILNTKIDVVIIFRH